MKDYKKPQLENLNVEVESVYAASGSADICRCSRGRRNYNPGADGCQECLGGKYIDVTIGKTCPEGMPVK